MNAVMYPHREDFMETISDYIDFSENEELWREEPRMFSLSQCIYEDGFDDGKEKGMEKGMETGIRALIQNNLLEGISRERTISNLKMFFGLTEERSEKYYERFAGEM